MLKMPTWLDIFSQSVQVSKLQISQTTVPSHLSKVTADMRNVDTDNGYLMNNSNPLIVTGKRIFLPYNFLRLST